MPQEHRKRSLSDSTSLKSPSIFTAEQLRKTKSYTTFPHIDTQSRHTSPSIHRTFCFRLMPHLSEDSLLDLDYPTISVMSRSSQVDNYTVASEVSSESEDSDKEQGNVEESVLHSWRRPSGRPRSHSEPVLVVEEATRARTWSLPDIEEKSSRVYETIKKVTASPSRLQFPEQRLEKLKEETGLSCQEKSVTSVADGWEENSCTNLCSFQEVPSGEEVTGHWINRQRRQSITCPLSSSLAKEVDEEKIKEFGAGDLNQNPSAVSLVNQVTEQVLSSHEDVLIDSDDEYQSPTVEAAVRLWKNKQSKRRTTLATVSPLSECSKYASEIEQQAFRKIKKWKDDFALKLDNVLGERFQEMAAKQEEEINRKKKPKVLKVPMNLSDKEMGQLKNNLLVELKRKSIENANTVGLPSDSFSCPPLPPIPHIKFPRRASTDQNPADLRAQMIKELNRRVSCTPEDEEALHCYKPSSLVPDLSKTSLQVKPQNVVYIPRGIDAKILDFESIRDLLSWHEAERKRLKAELERLPQAEQAGEQQLLIDKDDVNRVLRSMMKIMEDIFTGTMKRFIGSAQPAAQVEGSKKVTETLNDDIKEADSHIVERGSKEHEAKVDNRLNLTNEVSILSASDSTKSFSSGTSTELLSSESSLTGISFTSSNETFDVSEKLVNPSKYSKPTEETPLHSKPISKCSNVKKSPGEFTKGTVYHGTCENDKQFNIQQLQRALQDKSESDDFLKQRFESLKNKLSRTENKSDYWFNQCVKKGEKIRELLMREQNVNSFNIELRQQIVSKSTIIKEKDTEIQRITKSKNETKAQLQEVNMKLFKANEEVERLKMIVRQSLKEDGLHYKQLSVQPDETFEEKSSTFTKFDGDPLESRKCKDNENSSESKKCMANVNSKFHTPHKMKEDNTEKAIASCSDGKILFFVANNSEFQSSLMDSLPPSKDTTESSKFRSDVAAKIGEPLQLSELGRSTGSTPLENVPLRARNHILYDKKINKKIGIRNWVSEVIRSAKAELAREESLHNSSTKSSTDQKLPEHSVKNICDNETFKYPLRDIISSFKERISKSVKTKRSEGYLSGFNKRPVALSSSDEKGNRQQKLATDYPSVTFNSSAPYPDVFLTMFEYMDFSSVDNLISLEPFGDICFPWFCSEVATIKQLMRSSDPTAVTTELYLNKEEHTNNKRNLETVPGEQKVRADIPAIFLETSKKTAAERKEEPSFGNAQPFLKGIMTANQCISIPLIESPLSKRTPRDHSDGLVAKINNITSFSEQFTTVENDIERTIPEVYAKKTSSVLSPWDQRCLVGKWLHSKLNDSKFTPSTRNKAVRPNGHGFINSINAEIKLNTGQKQLKKELENRELFETQRPKESLNTQDSIKKLTLEEMIPQRIKRLPSEFNEGNTVCSLSSGLDQNLTHKSFIGGNGRNISETAKHAEDFTKRWIGDLLKHIRDIEHRDVFINGTAVESTTQPQYGTSGEALSWINKQIITNTKCKAKSNVLKSQPFVKGNLHSRKDSPGTKEPPRNILSSQKGQQEKSERDVRVEMWREKNGWLGNKSKGKPNAGTNIEHGLVWKTRDTKFSGRLKSSKMGTKTEERLNQDQIIQSRKSSSSSPAGVAVKNVIRDSYRARFDSNSTKKGKDMDCLMILYQTAVDVLKRQEEQKKAIQKCKDRVHFMTEELETLQRRTDEERSLKKGTKMASSQLVSSWL